MARLSDAGAVFRKLGPWQFFQRLFKQIEEDNLFAWASSLSYSWILALFPFLIFLLTLIPYLPDKAKAEAKHQIAGVVDTLPQAAAKTLNDFITPRLDDLLLKERKGLLTIGILVTLWAASGGIAATIAALDRAWDVDEKRSFFRRRISAVALTLIVSVMLMLVLFLLPIGTQVLRLVADYTPKELKPALIVLNVVRWIMGVGVIFLVIEIIYFFGPNIKQRWRFVSPGSLFCAVVWILLGLAFRIYVDRFGRYNETYGAVGGIAILLLVFYFDALALLIGAEINSEIAYELLGVPRGTRDFTGPAVDAPVERA